MSCWIAVCCVQYSHLFMSHWPPHRHTAPYCLYVFPLELTVLLFRRGNVTRSTVTLQTAESGCKLQQQDAEFQVKINHMKLCNRSEGGSMLLRWMLGKINTYIAWCNCMCTTAFLHREECLARLSVSDPLPEHAVVSCFSCSGQPHQYVCTWKESKAGAMIRYAVPKVALPPYITSAVLVRLVLFWRLMHFCVW